MTMEQDIQDIQEEPQEPVQEVEEAPVTESEVAPSDYVDFDGRQIPADQLRKTMRFIDWANQNPTAWDELVQWEQGNRVLVPAEEYEDYNPAQGFVDDDDDLLDEDDRYRALQAELEEVRLHTLRREEISQREAMQQGIAGFHQNHPEMEQEDWDRLFITARDHNLIGVYQERDPYNPAEAVRRAMETAYRIEFFDRAGQNGARQVVDDLAAKRRAAQASTNAGSVPRGKQDEELPKLEALAQDIRNFQEAQ